MVWFNYYSDNTLATSIKPPVRRLINFSAVNDNVKAGDWVYVSLEDLSIGKVYSYSGGLIQSSFDQDSFIIIYEDTDGITPTYSYINDQSFLYFKIVRDVNYGDQPSGSYYIYYHSDDVQYVEKVSSNYIRTLSPSGSNYMGSPSGSGNKYVDYYSHVIEYGSSNTRNIKLAYLGDSINWKDGKTNIVGSKVVGTFDGPRLKIYGNKGPDYGKISIKLVKTSSTTTGQAIVIEEIIDLYSINELLNVEIYEINLLNIYTIMELNSSLDYYGSFYFEIELLEQKNDSSNNRYLYINKYMFGKNYKLSFSKEQIEENISFATTGVIR